MFGGFSGIGMDKAALNDSWYFDITTKSWNEIESSSASASKARSFHKIICLSNKLCLFGLSCSKI